MKELIEEHKAKAQEISDHIENEIIAGQFERVSTDTHSSYTIDVKIFGDYIIMKIYKNGLIKGWDKSKIKNFKRITR